MDAIVADRRPMATNCMSGNWPLLPLPPSRYINIRKRTHTKRRMEDTRTDGWIDGWTDGWMNGGTQDGWMYGWMDGECRTDGWT